MTEPDQPSEPDALSPEDWRLLRDLHGELLEQPEAERGPFLDRALAGRPALRARMDSLLRSAASMGSFLAPREPGAAGDAPGPGTHVGPYRIERLLGQGGFGVVYLAEQERPIRRQVALKLIRPGMDTRLVIARFEGERQALALMDHPAIARVYDAGAAESGRPFFAMEYFPGVPITAFCDAERLSIRERLELFAAVCDAVQHAHRRGVIHRDLKPSNLLVTRGDRAPALKVIDFGIGKAIADTADDRSFLTREGMVLGTLGYMSPEQAGAIRANVDTRSDIYSLGVVLYELLVGELPFDRARLQNVEWSEAIRIIREEDPPGLAARFDRGSTAEVARCRASDERTLRRLLQGELEWTRCARSRRNRAGSTPRRPSWRRTCGATSPTSRCSPARRARCTGCRSSRAVTVPSSWLRRWCCWRSSRAALPRPSASRAPCARSASRGAKRARRSRCRSSSSACSRPRVPIARAARR